MRRTGFVSDRRRLRLGREDSESSRGTNRRQEGRGAADDHQHPPLQQQHRDLVNTVFHGDDKQEELKQKVCIRETFFEGLSLLCLLRTLSKKPKSLTPVFSLVLEDEKAIEETYCFGHL